MNNFNQTYDKFDFRLQTTAHEMKTVHKIIFKVRLFTKLGFRVKYIIEKDQIFNS